MLLRLDEDAGTLMSATDAGFLTTVNDLRIIPGDGQSLSLGTNGWTAINDKPRFPKRVKMFNGGLRTLNSTHDLIQVLTVVPNENIQTLVDAYEKVNPASGETPCTEMITQYLKPLGVDVGAVLSLHGIVGSSIEQLVIQPDWSMPAPAYNCLQAVRRAKAICDEMNFKPYIWTPFYWRVHGESNALSSGASYRAHIERDHLIRSHSITSVTGQWQQIKLAMTQPSSCPGSEILQAMVDMCIANPTMSLVTPLYFMSYVDQLHLAAHENVRLGYYIGRAMARVEGGGERMGLHVASAHMADSEVMVITLAGGEGPLVLDHLTVSDFADGNKGLRLAGTQANLRPESVAIAGPRTLIAVIDGSITGTPVLQAGMHSEQPTDGAGHVQAGPQFGPRTCVRTQSAEVVAAGAQTLSTHHWLHHGSVPLT